MYNLIEYSKNYRKTIGSLWNYYRDELSYDTNDNNNLNKNVINSESFKYKTNITGSTYSVNERITKQITKQIRFETSMLRSDLQDFSDAYIVVKGEVTVTGVNNNSKKNRFLAFKNNAPFTNCISKINNVLIDNAEDLDVVMPMYNLIEYSKNYRKTIGSLWNYYRDELSYDTNDNNNLNKNVINSESFKYKTNITGSTYNVNERITNAEGNQANNSNYNGDKSGKKKLKL